MWGFNVVLYVIFQFPCLKTVPTEFKTALDLKRRDCIIECTKEKVNRNPYLKGESARLLEESEELTRLILLLIRLGAVYMFLIAQHSFTCTGS